MLDDQKCWYLINVVEGSIAPNSYIMFTLCGVLYLEEITQGSRISHHKVDSTKIDVSCLSCFPGLHVGVKSRKA